MEPIVLISTYIRFYLLFPARIFEVFSKNFLLNEELIYRKQNPKFHFFNFMCHMRSKTRQETLFTIYIWMSRFIWVNLFSQGFAWCTFENWNWISCFSAADSSVWFYKKQLKRFFTMSFTITLVAYHKSWV